MHFQEVTVGRTLLATLEHGESLVEELERVAAEADLESAWFAGWGAVQDADLATFDQDEFESETVSFTEPLCLPVLLGTITRAEDGFDVTARAVLSRPSGQALAGVLESATVFGVEVRLDVFDEPLGREVDDATDMSLFAL